MSPTLTKSGHPCSRSFEGSFIGRVVTSHTPPSVPGLSLNFLMPNIQSLPTETLLWILKLAGETNPDLLNFREEKVALRTLISASLVTRNWKEPAQSLMWWNLDLGDPTPELVERVSASPVCGKYRTARLVLGLCWTS